MSVSLTPGAADLSDRPVPLSQGLVAERECLSLTQTETTLVASKNDRKSYYSKDFPSARVMLNRGWRTYEENETRSVKTCLVPRLKDSADHATGPHGVETPVVGIPRNLPVGLLIENRLLIHDDFAGIGRREG